MSNQGVMERLQWYQELRKIFNSYAEREFVTKSSLLKGLSEALQKLPLRAFADYQEETTNKAFAFRDIYEHIQSMKKTFKWDELLDSLLLLSCTYNSVQPATSINLVPPKAEREPELQRTQEKGTIKEDFPLMKFRNLEEVHMGSNLKFLSLGGSLLTTAVFEFPTSLIALNLSFNKISEFQPTKPLSNLKFLNLSHNLIENLPNISGIITVNELLVSHNQLSQGNFLFSIKNLSLLDLGFNIIDSLEDLRLLSECHNLKHLRLIGNKISGYREELRFTLPTVANLDPKDINEFSNFKQIGFCEDNPRKIEYMLEKPEGLGSLIKTDLNICLQASKYQKTSATRPTQVSTPKSNIGRGSPPIVSRAATPKTMKGTPSKHKHTQSYQPNGSLPTTPSLNNSCINSSNKRFKSTTADKYSSKPRVHQFGNSAAVMMIKPAANIFKYPNVKSVTIDISKVKAPKAMH